MNAAFNAGDHAANTAMFAPGAEVTDHMPLPDVPARAHGPLEIQTLLEAWSEGFTGFRADVKEYLDLGDHVVAVTRWRFVSADEAIEMERHGAEAYEVRDGKVVWAQVGFPDRHAAIAAVEARKAR